MLYIVLFITVVCGIGVLIVAIKTNRSISRLRYAADRFAQGNLSKRVSVRGPLQLAALAESLNRMARQLQDRLTTVVRQRNELGAVLSSMIEGVLAIDTEERIISLNGAAAELLHVDPNQTLGRLLPEVVRNTALQQFAARTLRENAAITADITLRVGGGGEGGGPYRYLRGQSAILRDEDGERLGAVLVLHDITHVRRLESVRRDFVANVSHEIKTPISAIKAAVETLIDDHDLPREDTEQFLKMVSRQADRLAAIVDDLLSLARIEQDEGRIRAEMDQAPVAPVLRAACETCQANADEREIELILDVDPGLDARMNPALCEQAVVNLIDNAIKYSPENTRIEVRGQREGDEVVLSIVDEGRGIGGEHLPRLFERFYRTDRARSRELGGTGLGLSIVKHIAEAHGGRVTVDSKVGAGSTFRIHLSGVPAPAAQT